MATESTKRAAIVRENFDGSGAEYLRSVVAWINDRIEFDNDGKSPLELLLEFDKLYDKRNAD
jgi:hypothetical protein